MLRQFYLAEESNYAFAICMILLFARIAMKQIIMKYEEAEYNFHREWCIEIESTSRILRNINKTSKLSYAPAK